MDSKNNVNEERRSLYCISIPGLNSWAKPTPVKPSKLLHCNQSGPAESNKRPQEDESFQCSKKIHMDEDTEMNVDQSVGTGKSKEEKVAHNSADLNLPIPDESATACLVTVSKCGKISFDIFI